MKFKWKVAKKETCPYYASFHKREWPTAIAEDDTTIAYISCEDSYSPRQAKIGNHAPLRIAIRCAKEPTILKSCPWTWRYLKDEFVMLAEAKAAFKTFVETHPDHDFVLESNQP